MQATISDIAKAAGVSIGSVSSVLNNKAADRRISEPTVIKIRSAAEKLGYMPNYCARGLRTQRSKSIGLLVNVELQHFYLSELISSLERPARRLGYHIDIGIVHDVEDLVHYTRSFAAGRCDGVLSVADIWSIKELDRLKENGIPVVLIYSDPVSGYDCICPDLGVSAKMATEYLIRKGHRKIVNVGVGVRGAGLGSDYVEGYRKTLLAHDIPFTESLVYECSADFEIARNLWNRIQTEHPDCTGVIAVNDDMALGLARGVKDGGKRIPEDVCIVAQNNTYPVRIADSPLASTKYDLNQVAEFAVQILIERMETGGPSPNNVYAKKIAPILIER